MLSICVTDADAASLAAVSTPGSHTLLPVEGGSVTQITPSYLTMQSSKFPAVAGRRLRCRNVATQKQILEQNIESPSG